MASKTKDNETQQVNIASMIIHNINSLAGYVEALDTRVSELEKHKKHELNQKTKERNMVQNDTATVEELIAMIDALEGLDDYKRMVHSIVDHALIMKKRMKAGLKCRPSTLNLVFTGNPGTGKTTVARLTARLYHKLGILSTGNCIEVTRADLVSNYIGDSEKQTMELINKATGGILFIDEAYSLYMERSDRDYGNNVINILVSEMENRRNDLMVIVAGYSDKMKAFLDSNPGLQSRFSNQIQFADYTPDQLTRICESSLNQEYALQESAKPLILEYFQCMCDHKDANFGNAREARNLADTMIRFQETRLAHAKRVTKNMLSEITQEDAEAACKERLNGFPASTVPKNKLGFN